MNQEYLTEASGMELLSLSMARWQRHARLAGICSLIGGATVAPAADFVVTSPGFFYQIMNLSPNPTLTLVRGRTYTFQVSTASIHPFEILSAGVVNNNISSGTITYTVPMAVSNYNYICSIQ